MEDNLKFAAPVPLLGHIAEDFFLKEYFRHFPCASEMPSSDEWRKYLPE
jgi:hypothetical protein